MPQVFQVLRCYKCLVFQVHQVKKSNKWECKLCGEKQSVKRHYGIGTGKECRLHVQKLNEMRGEKTEQNINYEDSDDDFEKSENSSIKNNIVEHIVTRKQSKWSNYVEKTDETNIPSLDEENTTLFGKEVVLELPKKCKNLHKNNKKNSNIALMKQSEEVYSEDYITNEPIVIPVSKDTDKTHKKQIKRFVPPSTNTPILNISNKVYDKEKYKNVHNASVGETHKQNSKWTEFMDNTESSFEQSECRSSQDFEHSPHYTTNPSNLFSLCDDNDLDSVLDI